MAEAHKLTAWDADLLRVLSLRRPGCLYEEFFCDRMTDAGLMRRGGYPDEPMWFLTEAGRDALKGGANV